MWLFRSNAFGMIESNSIQFNPMQNVFNFMKYDGKQEMCVWKWSDNKKEKNNNNNQIE